MRFTGKFEELKEKLKTIFPEKEWIELNDNHKQIKHESGVIINWYPTTGTVMLQGNIKRKNGIEQVIKDILENNQNIPSEELKRVSSIVENTSVITEENQKTDFEFLGGKYSDSELVIGLVGAVGTEKRNIIDMIKERLCAYNYETEIVHISKEVITKIYDISSADLTSEYSRIEKLINLGNSAREKSGDNSILALGASSEILRRRGGENVGPRKRIAYIINSLKHPEEVERLREIYSNGFFLIGIHCDERRRYDYLTNDKRMSGEEANNLIERDMNEVDGHGQHTRDTFQMADFFIHLDNNTDQIKHSIWRILDLIFGHPFLTPTFDEFAMFMAFTSALRSADLSRQVGAVIAKNNEILASGANDCPKAGGGLYWPEFDCNTNKFIDQQDGRDYMRGEDSNKTEQAKIVDDIIQCLGIDEKEAKRKLVKSKVRDITEYGRVVHAEMETLLMCARNNLSTHGATLYCTFPCHNCAKHIIAAGVKKVVYVEPYPKSKAFEFYSDSITPDSNHNGEMVKFVPFVGIGPRKFFELFSISMGSGYPIKRKEKSGKASKWNPENGRLRTQLIPCSYLEREIGATKIFADKRSVIND